MRPVSAHSLKIMRTYLKVIAQRIFRDRTWEEVSGERLLSKCLSLFYQTLGKKASDLKWVLSTGKDHTFSWGMQPMKHVKKSLSTLSKRNGLHWQIRICVVYSETAGKVNHDQLRPHTLPLIVK